MGTRSWISALALGLAASLASVIPEGATWAQSSRVFRADEVSANALIDALKGKPGATIPADQAAGAASADGDSEDPGVTRSIRVRPQAATRPRPQAESVAGPRPSASLLIVFETNSAQLTRDAQRTLDVVAKALSSNDLEQYRFAVEGHADPRGGTDFNMRLSEARAEAVRQYLVQRHGISQARLSATGKGDRELLNSQNPTAPENRRVTIVNMSN